MRRDNELARLEDPYQSRHYQSLPTRVEVEFDLVYENYSGYFRKLGLWLYHLQATR